jgi:hypothetical protein
MEGWQAIACGVVSFGTKRYKPYEPRGKETGINRHCRDAQIGRLKARFVFISDQLPLLKMPIVRAGLEPDLTMGKNCS